MDNGCVEKRAEEADEASEEQTEKKQEQKDREDETGGEKKEDETTDQLQVVEDHLRELSLEDGGH